MTDINSPDNILDSQDLLEKPTSLRDTLFGKYRPTIFDSLIYPKEPSLKASHNFKTYSVNDLNSITQERSPSPSNIKTCDSSIQDSSSFGGSGEEKKKSEIYYSVDLTTSDLYEKPKKYVNTHLLKFSKYYDGTESLLSSSEEEIGIFYNLKWFFRGFGNCLYHECIPERIDDMFPKYDKSVML